MFCSAINFKCSLTSQVGVWRPAASGCRSRNQEGTGCTCVSILVALLKSGRGEVKGVERSVMLASAAERKGRAVRSILSRSG
jgi:hypothetical protein